MQEKDLLLRRPTSRRAVGQKACCPFARVDRVKENALGLSHEHNGIKACFSRISITAANKLIMDLERLPRKVLISFEQAAKIAPPPLQTFVEELSLPVHTDTNEGTGDSLCS